MDAQEVKALFEHAKTLRQNHETEIEDAYRYTFPARAWRTEQGQSAEREKLYDATAVGAANDLRTTTLRLLVPQNRPWATIEFKKEIYKQKLASQFSAYLTDANESLFKHFRESNFYIAVSESLLDAIIAGTGAIAFVDGDEGLSYMSVPTNQLYFLEDHAGRVDCCFREHEMEARQVKTRFGKLPEGYDESGQTKKIKLVEAAIPKGNRYYYAVFDQSWTPLEETETELNPFVVWRWSRQVGEVWGEGPCRHALPHIRAANVMARDIQIHGNFNSIGLWQTLDDSFNHAGAKNRVVPGAILVTDKPIEPVQFPGNFNISETMINDQRAQIRTLMHANLAIRKDGQNTYMTAAEVEARTQQFVEEVGEPARRLQFELLHPIAVQTVARLQARGDLPKVPAEFVRAIAPGATGQGDLLGVAVNAAINKIAKQTQAQQTSQALTVATQTFGPELVARVVKTDSLVRETLRDAGIGEEHLRTDEEMAAEDARQQAQMQAAQLMQAADTKVANTVVQGVLDAQNRPVA
ncbi:portal protein [Ferrovibrio sp.]|uniref:portal protein n=1 Tax=Ferrovibrio sp. TaxID=1917215 RepID=UPI0035B23123